eukprot:5007339-Alexandrium_andersonii.AAC.1
MDFASFDREPAGVPARGRGGLGGSGSLNPMPSFRDAAVPRAALAASAGAAGVSADAAFSVVMFARKRS